MIVNLTIVRGGEEIEVEADAKLVNNGIGAYEYHGFRDYDPGQLECEEIVAHRADTGEEIELTDDECMKAEECAIESAQED